MFRTTKPLFPFTVSLLVILALSAANPRPAHAVITSLAINPNPVVTNGVATLTLQAQETDGGAGPLTLTVASGTLQLSKCQTSDTSTCTTIDKSGDGTSSITLNKATNGNVSGGEPLTLVFVYTPPVVTAPSSVNILGCQGLGCTPSALGALIVNPTGFVGGADEIAVSASASIINCGSSITVTAGVGAGGSVAPDGTPVLFNAGFASGVFQVATMGGSANATFVVPLGYSDTLIITASAGSTTAQIGVQVSCGSAGPPAQIALTLAPESVSCANSATIIARVSDQFAHPVTNGTSVSFATNLGFIVPSAATLGGLAQSVLTTIPNRPGTATIVVTAGTVSSQVLLRVVCATPTPSPTPTAVLPSPAPTEAFSTVQPPTPAPARVVTPVPSGPLVILPPNTGDGGLSR